MNLTMHAVMYVKPQYHTDQYILPFLGYISSPYTCSCLNLASL